MTAVYAGRLLTLYAEDELEAAIGDELFRAGDARRQRNEAARRLADAEANVAAIRAERNRRWHERKAANR